VEGLEKERVRRVISSPCEVAKPDISPGTPHSEAAEQVTAAARQTKTLVATTQVTYGGE